MYNIHDLVVEWREKGYIKFVKWRTVNDEQVCEICSSRAEKEFFLDEIENLMPCCDECRCWVTPIVDLDLLTKQREERWKGINFDE